MFMVDPAVLWTISVALALLFGASSAIKFADVGEFRATVENYRIVPESLAAVVAAIVPVAEVAGGLGILMPSSHRAAATLLLMLLAVFTAAIVTNLMRGRLNVDCGCFGRALPQPLSWWLPARNAILMTLAAFAMLPSNPRITMPLDFATIAFGAASIVLLYLAANYLLANLPRLSALEASNA